MVSGADGNGLARVIAPHASCLDFQRGAEGNGPSSEVALSANGRFVAFTSSASNLVAEDNNGVDDVFVHDLKTGETKRVSVNNEGVEGNGKSDVFISRWQ